MITIPNLKVGIFHHLQSSEERAIQRVLRMMNLEKDEKASIWIVVLKDTVDEEWTRKALSSFENIKYLDYREI